MRCVAVGPKNRTPRSARTGSVSVTSKLFFGQQCDNCKPAQRAHGWRSTKPEAMRACQAETQQTTQISCFARPWRKAHKSRTPRPRAKTKRFPRTFGKQPGNAQSPWHVVSGNEHIRRDGRLLQSAHVLSAACKLFFPMESLLAADVHICPLTRFGSASELGRIPACMAAARPLRAGRAIVSITDGLPISKPPCALRGGCRTAR